MSLHNVLIVFEKAGRNYNAYAPHFPGCMAAGDTIAEAGARIRRALTAHIRGMKEDGVEIPADPLSASFVMIDAPDTTKEPVTPAVRLRMYRREHGLTQAQLAKELDVTKETVSEWERGGRPIPGTLRFALA